MAGKRCIKKTAGSKRPPVPASREAGEQLFTFLGFRSSQWKALRTTNALERINEEFRRRTKTLASLPSQDSVLLLLFGLLRSGQVKLRALVGYQDMEQARRGVGHIRMPDDDALNFSTT